MKRSDNGKAILEYKIRFCFICRVSEGFTLGDNIRKMF